jgi:hypothetical protein
MNGDQKSQPPNKLLLSFAFLALGCAISLGLYGQASPVSDTPGIHFFVEPLLQKAFGGTSYDLSYDQGGGTAGLSRLEFPCTSLEAGAMLGITIERGGKREWLIEAGAAHSTFGISATMNDYDWTEYSGYPKIPYSYTYSQDTTTSWSASLEAAWTLVASGPWSLALYGLYRYQDTNHVEDGATGWEYVWNSSEGAYDLYGISDTTSQVLTYDLAAHTLGFGLLADLQGFSGFTIELRAAFTPVYASDRDDHVLRTKVSTASGWGSGLFADLRLRYDLPQVASVRPYLALNGQFTGWVVQTTQTQYWYGNADAAHGAPQGTLITEVGHVITAELYQVGLRLGFKL